MNETNHGEKHDENSGYGALKSSGIVLGILIFVVLFLFLLKQYIL